jgi:hypothetical protein
MEDLLIASKTSINHRSFAKNGLTARPETTRVQNRLLRQLFRTSRVLGPSSA